MHLKLWLAALLAITAHAAAAAPELTEAILMTFWSDDTSRFVSSPMPGSINGAGATQDNTTLRRQLDAINVLAYSFLQVDDSGNVYFRRPEVDLGSDDAQHFCQQQPLSCPNVGAAAAGSFSAFARLTNTSRTLRRIISIGGADSQRSFDNALAHPLIFVQSAAAVIRAYSLDGIDLDFEPDAFFAPGQGEQYSQLVADLRKALGERAFISIEVPSDWETLRSVDCPADTRCHPNLGRMAADAYVSLMGYEFHAPDYPGDVTGNNSNLYSDPEEPLVPRFYHVSVNQAIEYLTSHGVPAGRLLLGFPAYFVATGESEVEAAMGSTSRSIRPRQSRMIWRDRRAAAHIVWRGRYCSRGSRSSTCASTAKSAPHMPIARLHISG